MIPPTVNKNIEDSLRSLTGQQGILGCLLVSPEGVVVSSTLPQEIDTATLASITATLYSNNDVSIQRMSRGNLMQMTLLTNQGILHLHSVDDHILIVFTIAGQKINLEGLIKVVDQQCDRLIAIIGKG
jgi:predicted regulator of Ras-like GTPase activity (Roadblock/LC7/MglB family)